MMNERGPIFIVGPSRSGTALMRSILNRHPDVHIATETHYFDDLRRVITTDGPLSPDEEGAAVDYFRAITHRPYGHLGDPELGWLDANELRDAAAALGGGADSFLQAFCELSGNPTGGPGATIWGEKTPRHVFRVNEILQAFPDARIVAMVRDPRAVVASYKKWRNQGGLPGSDDIEHERKLKVEAERTRRSYHPLLLALLWRSQVNAGMAAVRRHGPEKVHLLRYEDLVRTPAEATEAIEALTGWLGLDYAATMLDVPMHNSSFSKFDDGHGISNEAIERWREVLDGGELAVIQRTCATLMDCHGYPKAAVEAGPLERLLPYATFPLASVNAVWANSSRGGSLPGYVARRVKALVAG